jgi:hypothetical protein
MKTTRKASNRNYFYKNIILEKVHFQSIFSSENVFFGVISLNRVIYIIPSYHQQEQQQLANKVDSNWSNSKNNIMIMYSVLSVYSNVLESFTNDEFNEYLSVLRYLIENSSKIYI